MTDDARPRIVDVIFAGELPAGRLRMAIGLGAVLALYAGIATSVALLGQAASGWSVEMAARVHDLVSAERAVEVAPPPKPPAPPPPPPEAKQPTAAAPRLPSRAPASPSRAPAPAQAGKVVAASTEPVDLTGMSFVVGSSDAYAGGTTTTTGTSRTAVNGAVAPTAARAPVARSSPGGGLARDVALDQSAWACPWPEEADAQQIDEQTVVIRARVRVDGRVDGVDVLSDPGSGFAASARACALRTRFEPARDARGQAIAATSPPIRVHFFR